VIRLWVCKSKTALGVCGTLEGICSPLAASCLTPDFTQACCGLGGIGFWNPVEVY